MDTLLKDVVYAFRSMRKSPTFASTAVLTIALGIGACATTFSVVNAVLLRQLPYQDPSRLVYAWADMRNRNVVDFPYPPGDVSDLQQQGTLFEGVAGIFTGRMFLRGERLPTEQVVTAAVTTNFFRVLGARIAMGRDFTAEDAAVLPPPPAPPPGVTPAPQPLVPVVAVISHSLWQRRFGGDPSIVGRTIPWGQNNRAQVIGVLDANMEVLFPPNVPVERLPEVYTAPRFDFVNASRANVSLRVVARLEDGVSVEQAQAQADQVAADLRRRFPVKETAGLQLRVEPMHGGLVADVRPSILALMGAVVFVLLVACANVANLLLVRAGAREREFAIRAALGGSRIRLVRQVLVESLAVALAGAVLGLALADVGVQLLVKIGPADLPRLDAVSIDWNVALFAGAAAFAAAIVFGLVPALRASSPGTLEVLRSSGRVMLGGHSRWLRDGVVLAEVALSFVLLVGCGLMIRSFISLQRIDPGYDYQNVLTFVAQSDRPRSEQEFQVMVDQMTERLRAVPGVTATSASTAVPLDNSGAAARWGTADAVADPNRFQQMTPHFVRTGYFDVLRTRLIEGRTFTEDDQRPTVRVVIIDSIAARKAFPGQPAVGKRVLARVVAAEEAEWYDVVGVVEHQRRVTLAADGREGFFFPEGRLGPGAAGRWIVRTASNPAIVAPAIRTELARLDPSLHLAQLEPLETQVRRSMAGTRFALVLISIFAAVAVALASIGLYGVLASVVRQRTPEIGVRVAFGAQPGSIVRLFLTQGLRLSLVGIGFGVLAALALTRGMATMLVGVQPSDPLTFAVIGVVFVIVSLMACWLPARRAARLDPISALRDE